MGLPRARKCGALMKILRRGSGCHYSLACAQTSGELKQAVPSLSFLREESSEKRDVYEAVHRGPKDHSQEVIPGLVTIASTRPELAD